MLGIRYFKASPTQHIMLYRRGKLVRQGAGESFFYFAPSSTLVAVRMASVDVPFVFQDVTADFQEVTIQGQLSYRVVEPERLAKLLDHTIDRRGRYQSDDPGKINDRLIQLAQVRAHAFTQRRRLEDILPSCAEIGVDLVNGMKESPMVSMTAIEVLALDVISVKPNPEMAKAMQANAREQLLLRADQAVHARRNTAIELERQLKENELRTERVVEERRREVRQAQMEADVAIEQQRAELVEQQIANNRKLADAQNDALRAMLDAMKSTDWKTLVAVSGANDPKCLIAMAFQQLAENASRIGRLDISPDLLKGLMTSSSE